MFTLPFLILISAWISSSGQSMLDFFDSQSVKFYKGINPESDLGNILYVLKFEYRDYIFALSHNGHGWTCQNREMHISVNSVSRCS